MPTTNSATSMSYVSATLRQQVIERAKATCEYCLFPQSLSFLTFEMEHIIAEKHGGATAVENLALACPYCNRAKRLIYSVIACS